MTSDSKINLDELVSIYGVVPSFHDAHVLEYRRVGPDLFGKFYIYDLPSGIENPTSEDDKHVVAELIWKAVRRADIYVTDNWLYRAEFTETSDGVRTDLYDMASGMCGVIDASSVAVSNLVFPKGDFEVPGLESIKTVHFSIWG
jgi:hypothetical protein